MVQQGQVFPLAGQGRDSSASAAACSESKPPRCTRLEPRPPTGTGRPTASRRVLEQLRREQGLVESPTLAEFVDVYLAQHEGEPETTEKLRWLLQKAVRAFGEQRLG